MTKETRHTVSEWDEPKPETYIGEESVVFRESEHAWIEADEFIHLEDMA